MKNLGKRRNKNLKIFDKGYNLFLLTLKKMILKELEYSYKSLSSLKVPVFSFL